MPKISIVVPFHNEEESSEGIAAAVARAISTGAGGRVVIVVAAMTLPLSPRADCGNDRKTWSQFGGQTGIIQADLHWNALHDLGEISGGIVGRE